MVAILLTLTVLFALLVYEIRSSLKRVQKTEIASCDLGSMHCSAAGGAESSSPQRTPNRSIADLRRRTLIATRRHGAKP